MTWIKLDDGFADHPKLAALPSDSARWFHVRAMCYAARYRTGGAITATTFRALGGKPATAAALVEAGLWELDGDGWRIHDFEVYNPPNAERRQIPPDEIAAKRAEAGRKGAEARWQSDSKPDGKSHGKPDGKPDSKSHGKRNGNLPSLARAATREYPSRPVPSRPLPVPGNSDDLSSSSLPGAEQRRDDDDSPDSETRILSALNLRRIEPAVRDEVRQLAAEEPAEAIVEAIAECRRDNVKPWPREIRARIAESPERVAERDLAERKRKFGVTK